jgi:hypothetical protein
MAKFALAAWQSLFQAGGMHNTFVHVSNSLDSDREPVSTATGSASMQQNQAAVDLLHKQLLPVTSDMQGLPAYLAHTFPDWEPVTASTVAAARKLVVQLSHALVKAQGVWRSPHVASDGEGAITLEWWHGDRSLTLYVREQGNPAYLLAWGTDMWNQMESGELRTVKQWLELWRRLQESE